MNNMIKAGSSAPPSRWVVIVVVIVIESLRVVVGVRVVVDVIRNLRVVLVVVVVEVEFSEHAVLVEVVRWVRRGLAGTRAS